MRLLRWVLALAVLGAAGAWILSAPPRPDPDLATLTGDAEAGALVFAAAGCASCHIAPEAEPGGVPVLSGGKAFATDFGTFYAPNISPSPDGIGGWTDAQIIHAVQAGVSPDGRYYYPAFPTHAYALAETRDIADLVAHLRTLPVDATPTRPHDVGFPFSIRRSLWGWRLLFAPKDWIVDVEGPELERGRYLVEALGHCGECHTPRNALGGLKSDAWLTGAPLPTGKGRVPGITPGILGWSKTEIANYLESGFTPEFDVAGGEMVDVIANTSQLTDADRAAIAAYLVALPE